MCFEHCSDRGLDVGADLATPSLTIEKGDEAVLLEWKELICFRTPKRTGDFAWIGLVFVKVDTWMLYPATINALGI